LYYQVIRGRISNVWRDSELRCYIAILFIGSMVVIWSIADRPMTLTTGEELPASTWTAVLEGVFTTVSLQTTTGFCTANFDHWPFLAKGVLVLLMFVGASAGSTGGGIKVIRIVIAAKVLWSELERAFRPSVIRPVRVGAAKVSEDLKLGALAYVLGIILLFGAGTGALMVLGQEQNVNITTAATAAVATLCNIGPGLDLVGAVQNYGWFSDASKLVLAVLMLVGRLEVFAILVLIHPSFWRTN
jgi:trk system potassium uptake protein TrkH